MLKVIKWNDGKSQVWFLPCKSTYTHATRLVKIIQTTECWNVLETKKKITRVCMGSKWREDHLHKTAWAEIQKYTRKRGTVWKGSGSTAAACNTLESFSILRSHKRASVPEQLTVEAFSPLFILHHEHALDVFGFILRNLKRCGLWKRSLWKERGEDKIKAEERHQGPNSPSSHCCSRQTRRTIDSSPIETRGFLWNSSSSVHSFQF